MIKYHFIGHSVTGWIEAASDRRALTRLKEQHGKHLPGLMTVYVIRDNGSTRTVWME